MKRAKVSSVYEESEGKRGKEGEAEGENSSKSATARTNGLRVNKAVSIISNRTMITRSMSMKKTMETKDEETLFEVEVMEGDLEELKKKTNTENKPAVEEQQPAATEVVEKKEDDVAALTLDDWPLQWSYEEEWSWFKVGYECGWYSYWETMNGDYWIPTDENNQAFWNDEPWAYDPDDEIQKP